MDIENIQSWVSQPDVCRCCLSASGTLDVTASYLSESGLKEVYFDMLQTCYGISLSCITQWGPSRMVCKLCIGHIREACSFRDQVLQAEKHFIDYWNTKGDLSAEMKTEVESEQTSAEGFASDGGGKSDAERKPDGDVMATVKSERDKHRRKKVDRARRKKKIATEEYDSDVPISAMLDKIEPSSDAVKSDFANEQLNKGIDESSNCKRIYGKLQKIPSQSVTDNRSLRANITLILKNTTIVPFRHINNSKFACLYCDDGFLLFQQLRSHMGNHKAITESEIRTSLKTPRDLVKADLSEIACRLCAESFKHLDNAIDHLVEKHKKTYHTSLRIKPAHGILGFDLSFDQLKCHVCSKQFRFFKNLSVHMNEHSTTLMCHVCGKKFISDHRLQTHIMMHKRTNIFCKHCNRDFKSVAARNYHIRKEHNEAPYKCPECKESFTQYHHRLKHLVDRHKLKKPEFKCDICDKELASSGGLAAHKRYSHLKTVQYTCDVCGKVFAYKWIWQRHIDVHTGAKNFECKFCSKRFAKAYSKQMHERIHLNDKRYVCVVCDAAFVQKCSLKNHTKVHHPDAGGSKT